MNKQFTKGPWAINHPDGIEVPNASIDVLGTQNEDDYDWIASVHVQFKGLENGAANARLIAAAPELFDLLEEVSKFLPDGPANKVKQLLNRITAPC